MINKLLCIVLLVISMATSHRVWAIEVPVPNANPARIAAITIDDYDKQRIYNRDETIQLRVHFSGLVDISTAGGTPTLLLNLQNSTSTPRSAQFVSTVDDSSNPGATTALFQYTVIDGDYATDLNYSTNTPLILNGGTIMETYDDSGNVITGSVNLSFPDESSADSLGGKYDLVVDTIPPEILDNIIVETSEPYLTKPKFSGVGEPGIVASILVDLGDGFQTWVCEGTIGLDGKWSCEATFDLEFGSYNFNISQTDLAGNTSEAAVVEHDVSTTPSVTGFSVKRPAARATPSKRPVFVGTGSAGAMVAVTESGTESTVCNASVDLNGDWTCTSDRDIEDGDHSFVITQTDIEGGVITLDSTLDLSIDTVSPDAPSGLYPVEGSTVSPFTTLSGRGEAGATVAVTESSTEVVICSAVVDSFGYWNCTPEPRLADGTHSLGVDIRDLAGNRSDSVILTIIVDSVSPVPPAITSSSTFSSNQIPVFSGVGEPGSKIQIVEDGLCEEERRCKNVICEATVDESRRWSCSPEMMPSVGTHSIRVYQVDSAGNYSEPLTGEFVILGTQLPQSSGGGGGGFAYYASKAITPVDDTDEFPNITDTTLKSCPVVRGFWDIGDRGRGVRRIQQFLNIYMGEQLKITGLYNLDTFEAVKRYQIKYADQVLKPWGLSAEEATGFWYVASSRQANIIAGCSSVRVELPNGTVLN